MYDDLIVMTFNRQEEAFKVWLGLDMMRDKRLLGLNNTLMVAKDKSGHGTVLQSWELIVQNYSQENHLPRILTMALFAPMDNSDRHQLAAAGLDSVFLQNVNHALKPDSSALLFYIPQNSLIDRQRLLDTLSLLRGTLFQTTFPAASAKLILNQGKV